MGGRDEEKSRITNADYVFNPIGVVTEVNPAKMTKFAPVLIHFKVICLTHVPPKHSAHTYVSVDIRRMEVAHTSFRSQIAMILHE